MSVRDIHLHIGRLVVHDDRALPVADLEAAIGQAIRQRLESPAPVNARRSLPETIADGVFDHPRAARHMTSEGS